MELIITEKASVARTIASVLNVTERADGYLRGRDTLISWCIGHLVELALPEAYDPKYVRWRYKDLPILPAQWQYEVDSDNIASFLKLARKYREADELTTPMIYAFVEKIIVHAPEKIDGERHMQIDIYLKFIGNFQVPQDEPTAEEMAEEEKQKQRRAKNREKVARCMERKKLKDAQEKEDAAHENDSAV